MYCMLDVILLSFLLKEWTLRENRTIIGKQNQIDPVFEDLNIRVIIKMKLLHEHFSQ